VKPDRERFLTALASAAYQVSVEKLFLTDSFDAPIYPESLVQVFVAQNLSRNLHCSRVELEFPTNELERELCGTPDCLVCSRPGRIDVVCWSGGVPLAAIEVKDQISGTDDGLLADAVRLQELLDVKHRIMPYRLTYGGLVAYVGKNSQQYKEPKFFDHQLEPYSERTVETLKRKITEKIDSAKFDIHFRSDRCIDSSKDAAVPDPNTDAPDADLLSGEEQMTKYVVAVLVRKEFA
jgi:hypothetical protein